MKRKQISKIVSKDKIFVVYQVESVYKEKALIQVNYFLLEYVDIKGGEYRISTALSFEELSECLRSADLTAQERTKVFEDCYLGVEPFTIAKTHAWVDFLMTMLYQYDYYDGWRKIVSFIECNQGVLYGKNIHDIFKTNEVLGITKENYGMGFCKENIEDYDKSHDLTNILTHVLCEIVGKKVKVEDNIIRID